LILSEKTGRWAAALRLALDGGGPQIVETRSLAACEQALAQSPASLVAVEASPLHLEPTIEFIRRMQDRFSQCAVVALMATETVPAAPLLQEAGAIDALTSILEAPRLARLAQRQLALVPPEETTLRDLTARRMPWAAHATT
jgi:DNA-binding NtrC family response regulator